MLDAEAPAASMLRAARADAESCQPAGVPGDIVDLAGAENPAGQAPGLGRVPLG